MEGTIDDTEYLLIIIYEANTKQHQFETLQKSFYLLENVVLAGDFNFFFNKKLECKRERPILKKQSVNHIIKLQDAFDLCDIWRIRNPKKIFHFQTKAFFRDCPMWIGLLIYFKQSSRNNFKRRYFECILNRPFPNFVFLHKLYERPGFLKI